jgi:hypothetical protein
MSNSALISRFFNYALPVVAILFAVGLTSHVAGQERDPFAKPFLRGTKGRTIVTGTTQKPPKPAPTVVGVPPIQDRIESYKAMRVKAAEVGVPAPKPTSVLTVGEIDVTGIFRTPRGYAAMVEATPIKLSYTVYPGEKFFDGYLVAIEDNRLVFRRETRMTDGKVITVSENKGLKVQVLNEMLVPRVESANNNQTPAQTNPTVTVPATAVPSNSAAPAAGATVMQSSKGIPKVETVLVEKSIVTDSTTETATPRAKAAKSKPAAKRAAKPRAKAPKQVASQPTF